MDIFLHDHFPTIHGESNVDVLFATRTTRSGEIRKSSSSAANAFATFVSLSHTSTLFLYDFLVF